MAHGRSSSAAAPAIRLAGHANVTCCISHVLALAKLHQYGAAYEALRGCVREAVTSSGQRRVYKHVNTVMLPMVCILFETSATNADSPCLASQHLHELALRSHTLRPERSFHSGTRHSLLNTLASSVCYMRRVLQARQPGRAADSATGAVCTALAASRPPGAARHGRGHHRRPVPAATALQCAAASRCGMLLPQDEHPALECCVYVRWPPADGQ